MLPQNDKKPYSQYSDEEIVRLLIQDDEAMVQYFFYEKCEKIFQYFYYSLFYEDIDIKELTSEFYLYLKDNNWRKLKSFSGVSHLTTWISVVAANFFKSKIEYLTGRINEKFTLGATLWESGWSSDESQNRLIAQIDLYRHLGRLASPRERYVLTALCIEGKSDKEVAGQLGIKIENLYNIKSRACKHLAELMEEHHHVN